MYEGLTLSFIFKEIVVKIVTKKLGDRYYKKKAVVKVTISLLFDVPDIFSTFPIKPYLKPF